MSEPLAMKIAPAAAFLGVSKSRLYELLALGEIEAKKSGRLTLVTTESMRAYLKKLPVAKVTSARAFERKAKADEMEVLR